MIIVGDMVTATLDLIVKIGIQTVSNHVALVAVMEVSLQRINYVMVSVIALAVPTNIAGMITRSILGKY